MAEGTVQQAGNYALLQPHKGSFFFSRTRWRHMQEACSQKCCCPRAANQPVHAAPTPLTPRMPTTHMYKPRVSLNPRTMLQAVLW